MKGFKSTIGSGGEIICDSSKSLDFTAYNTWKNQLPLKSDAVKPSITEGQRIKVYVDVYGLMIDLLDLLRNVPRDCKITIVPEIEKDMLETVRSITRANESRDAIKRVEYIEIATTHMEDLKLLIRILSDIRAIAIKQYMCLSSRMLNITNQLSAWIKYIEQKRENENSINHAKA